ncbi:MAG: NADPH-dependent glutamate synthase [Thermoproteales archaeon]|nr:NADPH-dependent glutamate synthase [Thermoproteales archaeon]
MGQRKIIREGTPMRKLSLKERRTTFKEVALGYNLEEALREAERCLQCPQPPCVKACPLHIDIPGFIRLLKERRFEEAIEKIKETNEFPAITGRVCPQELLCQEVCVMKRIGDPVFIGRLERFLGDYEIEKGIKVPEKIVENGKSVAIVGSGPAGLFAAARLRKLGYKVTIYEALHRPGGVMVYGIPEFRLPRHVLDAYINYLKKLGVEIKVDHVVGKAVTVAELLKEYDAVLISTGAGTPRFLRIPGEELNGIYSANEFLIRVNLMKAYRFPDYDTPIKVGKRVVVVGGGNTAMDVARISLRLGAEVTIIYRRTEKEMPARREEVENAMEEGVKFQFLTQPIEFIGDEKGWVKKIRCIKMRLGEPDESGRRRPIPIPGSEFEIEADTVVIAIGASVNPIIQATTPGLKADRKGRIIVDENGRTSLDRIYAAGDVTSGEGTVIEALAEALKAVNSIHRDLES